MTAPARTRVGNALTDAGLLRRPGLRTEEENRSASWLELFFDLAFVLVVAELASALGKDLSLKGVLTFAALFAVTWWSWASSTLYANRFDTDDLPFRVLKLLGMLAVIGFAASAAEATTKYAVPFTLCYVAVRVVLFLQYLRAYRAVREARPTVRLYLIGAAAGALLWLVSLAVPPPLRYALWTVGVAVDLLLPFAVTFAHGAVPLHLEHLPERLALFLILVLGESIAAVAHGVHDVAWGLEAVLIGVVSFVLAAALWWTCFDLAGAAAKKLLIERSGTSRVATDIYFYGHLLTALGLAAVGVGIEHVILESTGSSETTAWTRIVLCGGVALFLVTISVTNSAMVRSWRSGWWWPIGAAVLAAADALLGLPALAVVTSLAAIAVGVTVTGIVQERRGRIELAEL
ncbi:MAG: low temperature requirement protein A [Actinomycetota bacterium]|nr:low temperature requirement protein A [Actinomycetota bacterium]